MLTSDRNSSEDVIEETEELTAASPRRRLESTASSLYFPGGWVTTPKGDRPSFEVATGEFSRPLTESGTISVNAVLSPLNEERKAGSDDKWRCIIM